LPKLKALAPKQDIEVLLTKLINDSLQRFDSLRHPIVHGISNKVSIKLKENLDSAKSIPGLFRM